MRFSPRSLVFAAALAASVPLFSEAVRAQPSAADEERRTRLFKEGKAAADSSQWVEAVEKFRKVVAIRSAPKALIALVVAEEHMNHHVAAVAAYNQPRQQLPEAWLHDGVIDVVRTEVLLGGSMSGPRMVAWRSEPFESVDIDHPEDLERGERTLRALRPGPTR